MSDDEEVIYKKPQKTIHYGSLENSEWVKQQTLEEIQSDEDDYEPESKKPATTATSTIAPPSSSGNINISNEYFDLEHEMYVHVLLFDFLGKLFYIKRKMVLGPRINLHCWRNLSAGGKLVSSMWVLMMWR